MVIDNADDSDVLFPPLHKAHQADALSEFLPQLPNGWILITSRSRVMAFRLTGNYSSLSELRTNLSFLANYFSYIINSERNVTNCSVAISSFSPRPLRWKASYWPARFG
jgi:hypothetical protein